ncbi:DUF397 domain-containing protein [Streptomyces sp. DSM 44915]|uniref:DUF397 domain-containing protein n=1 Tax=Streptomyces chisholmiae TaxID=3075540 RepID=A0ABU2JPV8_9ACTN|nr:DUF397 domain-containing protein [Streptomyces sp. DSM 44915]MDT0267018.1 DUF397 domain-containing protein [Streptomyces sp. DSM 44915]
MTHHTRTLRAADLAGVADWYKSSYSSGSGNNCVETADVSEVYGGVAVRDSKMPHGAALLVAPTSWSSFVNATGAGGLRPS